MATRRRYGNVATSAALALASVVVILPVAWIALAAFKTQIALLRGDVAFTPYLGNFDELLFAKSSDYFAHFWHSVVVAAASTLIVLAIATPAAYSMVRLRWPRFVPVAMLLFSLVFHMIPPITLVGPWYVVFRTLGLGDTYTALIATHVALNLPIGLAIMTVFVRDIPLDLIEAARIDGCTTPQLLWKIVLPLARPGLAAAGILAFVFSWNEFAVALNLTGRDTATVPVAIAKFAQEYEIKNGVMAAAAVLSAIPAIALLLFAQRHIVKGLTAGSVR
jgi:multiple sugar transport system permease protein